MPADLQDNTAAPWRPTHRLLAQSVRLLGRLDDRYLVEHPDGSMGWITGWPHESVMISVDTVEKEALHA